MFFAKNSHQIHDIARLKHINRSTTGLAETYWFKLRGYGQIVRGNGCRLVGFADFCRRDVAAAFEQEFLSEPVDPFNSRKLNGYEGLSRTTSEDYFSFTVTIYCFGKYAVVIVIKTPDGRFNIDLDQALSVFERKALADTMIVLVEFVHGYHEWLAQTHHVRNLRLPFSSEVSPRYGGHGRR